MGPLEFLVKDEREPTCKRKDQVGGGHGRVLGVGTSHL